MNRNNWYLLLIMLLTSAAYLSCSKYSNDLAIIPPTPPTPPTPPLPKTCIIACFSQTNSGNKPEFFMSITYNSNLNPTKISVFDSAANSQLFYASLTYASADSIRIDAYQYFKLDNNKRVSRFITKQNRFLDAVKSDYAKYYGYISQQKNDQINALNLLNNYIHDLTVSGQLSKHNIDDAKFEQERIMTEVNQIKNGLDNIMNDTDEISLNLRKKNII